jgi:hypothetical protein
VVEEGARGVTGEISSGLAVLGILGNLGMGAAVGAIVNHFLHERAERKRSERERQALAIFLRTEILVNAGSLDFLLEHPQNLLAQKYSPH